VEPLHELGLTRTPLFTAGVSRNAAGCEGRPTQGEAPHHGARLAPPPLSEIASVTRPFRNTLSGHILSMGHSRVKSNP